MTAQTEDALEALLRKAGRRAAPPEAVAAAVYAQTRRAWAAQGTTAMTMGVDEFTRYVAADITKWAHIVKVSGAKAE